MRDQDRRRAVDVAFLHDQLDDGGGRDGVEAARRRVVEDELRLADECARDGDASAHSARQYRGKKSNVWSSSTKAKCFVDALIDLFVGHALLDQLVGYVVADSERIEQRAFLEDHAGAVRRGKSCSSRMDGDLFAEELNAPYLGEAGR
jgi:hypothetical protein